MIVPLPSEPTGPAPARPLGRFVDLLSALFRGRLREQFFADVRAYAGQPDALARTGAAYTCLVAAVAWAPALPFILTIKHGPGPTFLAGLICLTMAVLGFIRLRQKKDPRPLLAGVLFAMFGAAMAASLRQSGQLAPMDITVPTTAALAVMHLPGNLRLAAIAAAVAAVTIAFLTNAGLIGSPPSALDAESLGALSLVALVLSFFQMGAAAWIFAASRDFAIEEVQTANRLILESANRSRRAMEAASVGLWDIPNVDLRRSAVSDSFVTATGYTATELDGIFGGGVTNFVHPDDVETLRARFATARRTLAPFRLDFRLKTKTRGYRWFTARAAYSKNPDGSLRVSGSLQDIDFMKAAENALRAGRDRANEANRAKSDFIAMMSHEVRTPLNAILGSVEALKRSQQTKEDRDLIDLIDDAGHGLLAMVSDMLDLSKIEAGKLAVSPEPTDLPALISRTVDLWRPQARSKGLMLSVDVSRTGEPWVNIDPTRLRQIVNNLLSNAVKFTDVGGVSIDLRMSETSAQRAMIELTVTDTGPGVPPAAVERIFAPFEQAKTDHARGGTGLGLFISRRLAELMGGSLTLADSSGPGARFRLSLTADYAAERSNDPEAKTDHWDWANRSVLVVDDNAANLRIARVLLQQFGLDVTACSNAAEALEICSSRRFDALLLDMLMPETSGAQLLEKIRRQTNGLNAKTPAIALTGSVSERDLATYDAAGFESVAAKPINVRELALALAPFMADARLRRAG